MPDGQTGYLVPDLSIGAVAEAQIEVKRSKFRCVLARIESEEEARDLVSRIRSTHWDARHHCSAFVIGPGAQLQRSSDDGEPSGTAGAPMLEVLNGAGVSDVAVVVTRWFGGVLLGAGGLVRAYSEAVRVGLAESGTRRRRQVVECWVDVSSATAGRVEADLRRGGLEVLDVQWTDRVRIQLAVAPDGLGRAAGLVAEVTGGAGEWATGDRRWVDVSTA